jgi:MarR family transcriptional regulator for hemolysin
MDSPPDNLLILLNDLARSIRTEADRRARAHGMTRAQWLILAWLNRTPGLSQRELAEIVEVEPITIARLVDRLAARDLVERRPDPDDRRIWRLHLRPAATPMLATLGEQRDEILRIVTDGIDPQALDTVARALHRMKTNMAARRRSAATHCDEEHA